MSCPRIRLRSWISRRIYGVSSSLTLSLALSLFFTLLGDGNLFGASSRKDTDSAIHPLAECEKLGPVTNVVLFDKEPEGVASVRYGNAEAAKACVRVMDGRHFSGMVVKAYTAEGGEKFKKSNEKAKALVEENGEGDDGVEDGKEDEESKRLDQFGEWLEEEGKKNSQ